MDNQPLLDEPHRGPFTHKGDRTNLLPSRRQYMEAPFPEAFEEPGPSALPEYLQILRRRKGTMLLITFLGLLTALLGTLPQTPIYQARASIEIQNLNENFLNMRNVSATADDRQSYAPGSDIQTQAKILQSESLLDRVAAKLDLGGKLFPRRGKRPPRCLAQGLGFTRGEAGANPRKDPDPGCQET